MTTPPTWVAGALRSARVARLATTDANGAVHLVPICFAVVGDHAVSAVDHKPKRTTRLQRLADIEATAVATLLVDHYDEDWARLWWVRITGRATVEPQGSVLDTEGRDALVAKYEQYHDHPPVGPLYRVHFDTVRSWRP